MKLAIAYCAPDVVPARFVGTLSVLYAYTMMAGHSVMLICKETSLVPKGRHEAVCDALAAGVDAVFFIDTDMLLPVDTIVRLLAHEKDVVGVNYVTRRGSVHPVSLGLDKKPLYVGSGVEEVAALGMGATLIRSEVFERMEKPYFDIGWEDGKYVSEDHWFCGYARDLGFSVWCDNDLSRSVAHGDRTLKDLECFPRANKK